MRKLLLLLLLSGCTIAKSGDEQSAATLDEADVVPAMPQDVEELDLDLLYLADPDYHAEKDALARSISPQGPSELVQNLFGYSDLLEESVASAVEMRAMYTYLIKDIPNCAETRFLPLRPVNDAGRGYLDLLFYGDLGYRQVDDTPPHSPFAPAPLTYDPATIESE